jgi:fructokinase
MPLLACVEGGGQSWVAAICRGPEEMVETASFVTRSPAETLSEVRQWLGRRSFEALGVASFGPVDAKKGSPTYGFITSTPKPGWAQTDVLRLLGVYDEFSHIPVSFDTDVNAPALAEFRLHGRGESCAYITVGTGVGVGLVSNGQTVKGLVHPEGGHVLVQPKDGDDFQGCCPFHGRCVEGMCSSGALSLRAGCPVSELPLLPDDHPVWDIEAYYLGQLCANLVLVMSPERISIGGGVLNRASLYPKIRTYTLQILNKYITSPLLLSETIDQLIGPSFW